MFPLVAGKAALSPHLPKHLLFFVLLTIAILAELRTLKLAFICHFPVG